MLKIKAKSPLDGATATLEFHSLKSIMSRQPGCKELKAFPGPLVPGKTDKLDVIRYVFFLLLSHYFLLDVKRSVNFKRTFWYPQLFQKTNEKIQLNYYDTSGRLVFVRFLEEFEDTKKTFRN